MSSGCESELGEEDRAIFRPFTRESLAAIEARIAEENERKLNQPPKEDEFEEPKPDPMFEAANPLPSCLQAELPPELVATPIEDIDRFYESVGSKTFIVVSKGKDIFRFSATDAMWLLSPFNPVRRVAIYVLVHPLFSFFVVLTILVNCVLMAMPADKSIEDTEVIFTSIYTFESCIKIMARGFVLERFTYLRDAWNWLDFIVIALAYITQFISLGNLSALRTFRVLRALKTVAIIPGLKTIVGAVIESVKNLKDVIILTMFSLSIFALLGLQIYMGDLRNKCIRNPESNISEEEKLEFLNNYENWLLIDEEKPRAYKLCGLYGGAEPCPGNYTCIKEIGENPNYDYTSFDSFGWAMLSSFRLMTQDAWEALYQMVLRCAGPYHMLFFVLIIFLGSYYLVNLILAIVAMSYDDLQKKADLEEEESIIQEEALRLRFGLDPMPTRDDGSRLDDGMAHSPSDLSSTGYDGESGTAPSKIITDDGNKPEKLSILSADCDDSLRDSKPRVNAKTSTRKGSLSLPGSPFNVRRGSRGSHQLTWRANGRRFGDKKPLVLSTFLDAQEHLPYADDSTAVTPMSEENGAIIVPVYANYASRHGSYTSHASRISYTSHGEINGRPITKETQLRSRRNMQSLVPEVVIDTKPEFGKPRSFFSKATAFPNNFFEESSIDSEDFLAKHKHMDNPFIEPTQKNALLDMKDVMVLNDIIEQAAGRRNGSSEQGDDEDEEDVPKWKERFLTNCLKCIDFFCIWECCGCWVKIQGFICLIVYDAFMELFITLCIVVNTLFMAMDHHDSSQQMIDLLLAGNYFFTAVFATEALMKLIAISPKNYFKEGWNIFDFIIVTLSFVELALQGVKGLSVLRSFRLLRVFKLAKSWPTLNLLISIMGKTIGALGNLTFVLAIIIFIFAVMGMQLFGKNYTEYVANFPNKECPRWHFKDFLHSFMIVFRVLCGEWIESMWDCMLVSGWPCIPFFLATVVIGNLVVLNLFLALLLSSFGASNLSQAPADAETTKLAEAIDRIGRFTAFVKLKARTMALNTVKTIRAKVTNQIADQSADIREVGEADDLTGDILIDGQVSMRDKKSPKEHMALEVALNDVVEITIHGDAVKLKTIKDQWNNKPIYNSIKKPCDERDNKEKEKELQANLVMMNTTKTKHDDDDAVSNRSACSYKEKENPRSKASSCISIREGDEKRDVSKEDLEASDEDADGRAYEDQDMCRQEGVADEIDVDKVEGAAVPEPELPQVCYPDWFYVKFPWCATTGTPFWDGWMSLRTKTFRIIENKYFETFIIIMILISSVALAVEDKFIDERQWLKTTLGYLDRIFTVIFFLEMLIKWLALGFKQYFSNAWCWLDFVIVLWWCNLLVLFEVIVLFSILPASPATHCKSSFFLYKSVISLSLINLAATFTDMNDIPAFRSMRTLRALRPLRAVSRWEGMRLSVINLGAAMVSSKGSQKVPPVFKTMRTLRALRPLRAMSRLQGMRVVVNALIQAIPSIFNVLLVCLIFWLIFSIMGVNLFSGKYFKCFRPDGKPENCTIIKNRAQCSEVNKTSIDGAGLYTWGNSPINFDNVGMAYLALFQVATFKGWMDIMYAAIDNTGYDSQPCYENNPYMYLFFVVFIIFGAFFTLNLFIGVIIDNFNAQKKKAGGSLEMFMTEDQKKYYNAMKKMGSKKPVKAIPRPRIKIQAIIFDITTNKKFDMVIMLFIALNMLTMAMEHHGQTETFTLILEHLNTTFIAIFTMECVLKCIALRCYYVKEPWNVFDLVVVILSIMGVAMKQLIAEYFVSPTLLRVVRVVKVGRVLRLVKGAKGIRTLLFALAMSLPALFNICLLLFLVMFIYAIFGMSFFMHVKLRGGLDETYNFQTFQQSMILLFQMSTSAGWSDALGTLMDESDCITENDPDYKEGGETCGNSVAAVAYLVSYLVISFLIIINMYIAVILENYSQATEEVQEGLTDDDYDMYYEIWQRFDPDGTQYISYDSLTDFLDTLEVPLQISKPNKYKIVSMDIPICKDDKLFCVDILDALTKDFFARKGSPVEESGDWQEAALKKDDPSYEPISSTLWRQREEFCARLIQKAWRRHKVKAGDKVSGSGVTTSTAQELFDGGGGDVRQQTAVVVVESDGHVTKNGHKVVIHSRSPSITSRSAATDV